MIINIFVPRYKMHPVTGHEEEPNSWFGSSFNGDHLDHGI
jgi:hypothetical protein